MASGADKIRILIVDDITETRENVRKLLAFETDIEVVGVAGTGREAIQLARELQPHIIMMDINATIRLFPSAAMVTAKTSSKSLRQE